MRPPIRSRASSTVTDQPARLRSRAAAKPAAPAPRIRTELRFTVFYSEYRASDRLIPECRLKAEL